MKTALICGLSKAGRALNENYSLVKAHGPIHVGPELEDHPDVSAKPVYLALLSQKAIAAHCENYPKDEGVGKKSP